MLRSAARVTSTRGISSRSRSFYSLTQAAGLPVATFDNGQSTSSVTFLVKAGSRYQDKPGVAHTLKSFGFKNTASRSALGIVREAELYGGVLSSAHTREYISYTADFLRGDESYFVDVLAGILTETRFTRYELEESVLPIVEAESKAGRANAAINAIELAHALAFRSGLGEPLFAPAHSHITIDDVRQFAHNTFGQGGISVIGTGISQDTLVRLLEKHLASVPKVSPKATETTKYYGGETRVEFAEGGSHAPQTVFFGFGVPGQPKPELAVLSAYLSPAASVKWSKGLSPLSAGLPEGTSAQVVHLPYTDASLFGIVVQGATPAAVTEAGKIAAKTFQNALAGKDIKDEDVKRAAAKAKFLAASAADGREGIVSTFGPSLLRNTGSLEAPLSFDSIQSSSLNKAVSELAKSKPTFVAIGDTYRLPHPDELGLSN
ncbi:hypothetical protein M422DRAFT_229429 [Sphaerobolus stellatus SS14]|uniref:Cytochrome b-c1 complex subunit 2, mitochondrial n=1 Tax=Sphaerobolus stellatus (strain SS14) TaxID=990650 RepID=A0A0C9UG10_SPHS4|nr:hypothetical protein M422DRAFT_229429 [Sphaerobolus stellatus SS14]